jgi:hypothetical protein
MRQVLPTPGAMPINTLRRQRRWLERIIGTGAELLGPSETGRFGAGAGLSPTPRRRGAHARGGMTGCGQR